MRKKLLLNKNMFTHLADGVEPQTKNNNTQQNKKYTLPNRKKVKTWLSVKPKIVKKSSRKRINNTRAKKKFEYYIIQ